MPNLTKIGRTDRSIEERLRGLNNTSVPFGFRCFYAAEVANAPDVERRLHDAFRDSHVGKEFFELHPCRAQRILEMVALSDATPRAELPKSIPESDPVINPRRTHLRRFSMARIGLKPGDTLQFVKNPTITATVYSDTEVLYEGNVQSLSRAALHAVQLCGCKWTTLSGPEFWLYQDQPLKEIEQEHLSQEGT